jgi:hypothetical protein
MERLRPQAADIATTPLCYTEERFGSVPRWYIECLRDNAITLSMQRWMIQQTPCKVLTLDSGHSPFFSMPETLVERLETVAKESVARETIA